MANGIYYLISYISEDNSNISQKNIYLLEDYETILNSLHLLR